MISRIKSFDVYRKLPKDLSEPTVSGAIVSLTCTFFMVVLFFSELHTFMKAEPVTKMFIDTNKGGEKLIVNLDISFPKLPCDLTSLDVQDVLGSHHVNVGGDLYKIRIAPDGTEIEKIRYQDGDQSLNTERARKAFADREGCRLYGSFEVNKVPGNFHISSHAYFDYLRMVFLENHVDNIDLSHQVNHLSFGDVVDFKKIKKSFDVGVLNPLDGMLKMKPADVRMGVVYQYYITVVPTTYEDLKGQQTYVHQFIAHGNEIPTNGLAVLYFRFDMSPVTVKHTLNKQTFARFLVQVCAILGGIFTIAGLVDALVYKSMKNMLKKAEMGKLG